HHNSSSKGDGGAGGAGGSANCGAPSVAGTAAKNPDGILTNYPQLRITKAAGDFAITTVYFNLTAFDATTSSIRVWGDLKNNGPSQLCIPLHQSFAIGTQDVLCVVDGNPYQIEALTSPVVCVEAGGTTVFYGIENSVSPTLLADATTLSYEFSGLVVSPPGTPHPDDPVLLSAAPKQVSGGWALAGQMRSGSNDIFNVDVTVYIRDPNGLIFDDRSAFPFDLGTIAANTMFDFETYSIATQFCAYERFDEFLIGTMAQAALDDTGNPIAARLAEAQRRKLAARAAMRAP
ncbi:MAG TPA: hypothetical protein VN903_09860, partial [Polyangia bacterium]|nr:hypothetical protein [Polyangia bacterium]